MTLQPQTIKFANGDTLSAGDTFYYVSPELHDGTIETCIVDSIWHPEYYYGEKIRFKPHSRCEWCFVYKQYFERENPTCFLRYDDAKKQAESQLYTH